MPCEWHYRSDPDDCYATHFQWQYCRTIVASVNAACVWIPIQCCVAGAVPCHEQCEITSIILVLHKDTAGYRHLTHWPLGNENFKHEIFKQIFVIDGWGISCYITLIWMSLDFTDDQSTLVQVMAWCCQATSHYLSQCWPRSLSPYGVTRPQWVKTRVGLQTVWNLFMTKLSYTIS